MTLLVWPWRLLLPSSQKTRLTNQSISGGISISGYGQTYRTDGGGRWLSDLSQISLYTENHVKAARAWSALLDGGATKFVLPIFDLAMAPRPISGGAYVNPTDSTTDDTDYYNNPVGFASPLIVASNIGAQAERSTTMVINIATGSAPTGGEHFSINHPTVGWRLYRIARVNSRYGSQYTCSIRPPLREALTGGEALEFDVPRCTMKLVASKADALDPDVQLGRRARVDAYFEEAF
jgi:hypothetical protein